MVIYDLITDNKAAGQSQDLIVNKLMDICFMMKLIGKC